MIIRILVLLLILSPVANAGEWKRRVQEFPDGPAKDAINVELASCGIKGNSAPYFHPDVKRYANLHSGMSGLDAARAFCLIRKVAKGREVMSDQDEWESQLEYVE